ncbi:MAG: hypothetical protein ACRCZK_04460 [Oscillospiraceae bacterium]
MSGNYYGIEVKSSKDDKWIKLGGSVNESTSAMINVFENRDEIAMTIQNKNESVLCETWQLRRIDKDRIVQ